MHEVHPELVAELATEAGTVLKHPDDDVASNALAFTLRRVNEPVYSRYLFHREIHVTEGIPDCRECERLRTLIDDLGLV